MMTPMDAITREQVWLRPFGHFAPEEQGYMGFSKADTRNRFLDRMEDGALVVIWSRQNSGETEWRGSFRGILQLRKSAICAADASSAKGESLRRSGDRDFDYAVPAGRAWEADPGHRVRMKNIASSIWPGQTQSIGTHSALMDSSEIPNILGLRIREVSVYGQPPVVRGPFDVARKVLL